MTLGKYCNESLEQTSFAGKKRRIHSLGDLHSDEELGLNFFLKKVGIKISQ